MQSNQEKEAIRLRLKALFEEVYEEALRNPDFFSRLETILLSPEARLSLQSKVSANTEQPSLNMLEVLHRDGEVELRRILDSYVNDDLISLCVQERIRKQKAAKSLERGALIDLLVETAASRLKQGNSFVKLN